MAGPGFPDLNVDALDFLLLIAQWSPSACDPNCEADITGPTPLVPDGVVDALDFLLVNAQWRMPGNCPGTCGDEMAMGGGDESESFAFGGLTSEDWATLIEAATDGSASVSANGICWMLHYIIGCAGESCPFDGCGGDDPLGRH